MKPADHAAAEREQGDRRMVLRMMTVICGGLRAEPRRRGA
jgi:hypothetical protein